jgi:hypothetical protein
MSQSCRVGLRWVAVAACAGSLSLRLNVAPSQARQAQALFKFTTGDSDSVHRPGRVHALSSVAQSECMF